jgi:prepilin-type N-terminal cleavage/methylation domain-containing protein
METHRRGFTMIELLIVIVVIGIIAAIAIPKFQAIKGKANVAVLKSDLRNLSNAEEGYLYEKDVYTTVLSDMSFVASPGVTITVTTATASGWAAKATSPQAGSNSCAIFHGNVPALAPAVDEGIIACQ